MAMKLARKTVLLVLMFISLLLIVHNADACGGVYSGRPSTTDDGDFSIGSEYFLSTKRTIRRDLNCTYRLKNEDTHGAILLYFDYFYLNDNGTLRQGDTLKISGDPATYYSYKAPQPHLHDTTTLNLTLSLYRSTQHPHIGFKAYYRFLSAAQRLAWDRADKYIGAETVSPYHGGLIDQKFALQQDASVTKDNKVHYTWYIRCNVGSNILLNFLNIELGSSTLEVWDAEDSKVQIKMDDKWSNGNAAEQSNRRSLLSDGNFMYIRWIGEAKQGDSIQVAFAYVKKDEACSDMYLSCQFGENSVCVSNELMCDGTNHCHDGEDEAEEYCRTSSRNIRLSTPTPEYTCPDECLHGASCNKLGQCDCAYGFYGSRCQYTGHYANSYSNIAAIIGGAVCIFFLLLLSCMACVAYIRGPQPGRDINGIPHLISVEPIGRMSSFDEAAAIAHSDLPPCYLEVVLSKSYRTASTTTLTKIDECDEMPAQPPPYDVVTAYDKSDAKVLEVQLNGDTCQPETRIWENKSKSRLVNAMKKKKKTNNPFCQHCNRQYRHECRVNEDWVCM